MDYILFVVKGYFRAGKDSCVKISSFLQAHHRFLDPLLSIGYATQYRFPMHLLPLPCFLTKYNNVRTHWQ